MTQKSKNVDNMQVYKYMIQVLMFKKVIGVPIFFIKYLNLTVLRFVSMNLNRCETS